ncbi:helix-turn-helix transcriptional regulator [Pseudorhizobium sp. NPDC055634]
MSVHLIVQLLVLAGEAKSAGELVDQFETLLGSYKFNFYELSLRAKPETGESEHILAARMPENWRQVYAAKRYGLVDPVARTLLVAQRPFRMRDAVSLMRNDPRRARLQRLAQDAARHGMVDGYVFPIHGRNGLMGSMSISGQPVDLSPVEISLFDTAAKRMMWRLLELRGAASEHEVQEPNNVPLTRREMEVISHLTQGLTSPEIARTLQISSHTVDWYINGLQDKMKARNRQHVVALALRKGIVI